MEERTSVLRDLLLMRLYDHLCDSYAFDWSREQFLDECLSTHGLDAILAYKSDVELEELGIALDRLHEGVFGTCVHCKQEIRTELLEADLSRRFCQACEREMSAPEPVVPVLDRR